MDALAELTTLTLAMARLEARAERDAAETGAKSASLTLVAHELRTPLGVLSGYLSMMQDGSLGDLPPQFRRPVDVAADKARQASCLVDDLLIAARIEGGGLRPQRQRVLLSEVATAAAQRASARCHAVGADLRVGQVRDGAVSADPGQLGCILDNLITNALTYAGTVPRVEVTVAVEGGRGLIAVEDDGDPIAPAARERIFEPFQRISSNRAPQPPGTGLGLAIAREMAARNGGSLALTPATAGNRFELRLPLDTSS